MTSIVIIPCFKTTFTAAAIAEQCSQYVDLVICIDDACPLNTWRYIQELNNDKIKCYRLKDNLGVGGAVKEGIRHALEYKATKIIKVDSDGQADPQLLPIFLSKLEPNICDFVKGNRFTRIDSIRRMPRMRLFGNLGLSFLSKLSTGYWELFDPTNGYIGFSNILLDKVEWQKTDNRYFFETEFLFRCSIADIYIAELGMNSVYEGEISSLKPIPEILNFGIKHLALFVKRLFYQYLILDFNMGSIMLLMAFVSSIINGLIWLKIFFNVLVARSETLPGTLTLLTVTAVLSVNVIIGFVAYDASTKVLYRSLRSLNDKYKLKGHQDTQTHQH